MISQGGIVHRFILETFAESGRSPTLEEIQRRLALSTIEEAESLVDELERAGSIHRNQGDAAITHAYPFSNEPTAHRVRLANGSRVFAMCAIDALGMPFMLKRDAEISSVCAECGGDIGMRITSEQIADKKPAGIVVWYADLKDGCCPATDLCPGLNFFCSRDHANQWIAKQPGRAGHILTLDEALQRGRRVFEALLYRRNDCCS